MAHIIMKLQREGESRYFVWSTNVDAPVTYGMTLDELKAYTKEEHGRCGLEELEPRLERVEQQGTSWHGPMTPEKLTAANRAGEKESCLTLDEIWQKYVVERPADEAPRAEKVILDPPQPWYDDWDDDTGETIEGFSEKAHAGMLIWHDGEDEPVLIGHMNAGRGVCACCVHPIELVHAYQVVWEPPTMKEDAPVEDDAPANDPVTKGAN